jgi:hypothetical protein
MMIAPDRVKLAEPIRHDSMSVFPLFSDSVPELRYELAASAMKRGAVIVEELGRGGEVAKLLVRNRGPKPVLFLEGETLHGAKQNRVLNVSILVPEGSTTVPVSCVEQGRWSYRSRDFQHGDLHVSAKMKYGLKQSVLDALRRGKGYRADQGEVWGRVSEYMDAHRARSATHDYAEVHQRTEGARAGYKEAFRYPHGCTGFAVSVGGQVVSLDLFGAASVCAAAWSGAMSGFAMDALSCRHADETPASVVEHWLASAAYAPWSAAPELGLGERRQARFGNDYGAELSLGRELVHLTLSARSGHAA